VASVRNRGESSRDSAKSGSVYAPERRSGATTNNVNTRYPAVKPIGYHSASTPSVSTTPATPRNDAAERYSPLTAAALRRERTVRRARRKSCVVLAERTERCPRVNDTSTTHVTAASAHGFTCTESTALLAVRKAARQPVVRGCYGPLRVLANSFSLSSAMRLHHMPAPNNTGNGNTPNNNQADGTPNTCIEANPGARK